MTIEEADELAGEFCARRNEEGYSLEEKIRWLAREMYTAGERAGNNNKASGLSMLNEAYKHERVMVGLDAQLQDLRALMGEVRGEPQPSPATGLSDEQLAETEKRVTECGACGGDGILKTCCGMGCSECPKLEPCGYCGRTGRTEDDEDAIALLAEVRRLRERVANDEHRIKVNSSALRLAKTKTSDLRCALAEAVELLREHNTMLGMSLQTIHEDRPNIMFRTSTFLAKHDGAKGGKQ
jgi:hypothetical protein